MVIDGRYARVQKRKKERNVQEENNGEHVRYIIRKWKQLRLFSLYLPTKVKNTDDVALNIVRVIEVASVSSTIISTFTNTLEP